MATTENMRVLTDQQTSTVASNVQGVQQARRLANASTVSPTVRHQRSVQADPNKLSKSLESIGNAVGNIAQDTYSLNNALVDEMISDDTAMMVHGLDEMDKSLKPGESRDNIIKVAGSYRAELMAKKGDFGGNADMQARYREKFINPSAAKTMAYVKEWQKQEYVIVGNKLNEEFKSWETNTMPLITKGLSGQALADARALVKEEYDKRLNELAKYGVINKTDKMLQSADSMSQSISSHLKANFDELTTIGDTGLLKSNGEINYEVGANIFNDRAYPFAIAEEQENGKWGLKFFTDDKAVHDKLADAWFNLGKTGESMMVAKKKQNIAGWNAMQDSSFSDETANSFAPVNGFVIGSSVRMSHSDYIERKAKPGAKALGLVWDADMQASADAHFYKAKQIKSSTRLYVDTDDDGIPDSDLLLEPGEKPDVAHLVEKAEIMVGEVESHLPYSGSLSGKTFKEQKQGLVDMWLASGYELDTEAKIKINSIVRKNAKADNENVMSVAGTVNNTEGVVGDNIPNSGAMIDGKMVYLKTGMYHNTPEFDTAFKALDHYKNHMEAANELVGNEEENNFVEKWYQEEVRIGNIKQEDAINLGMVSALYMDNKGESHEVFGIQNGKGILREKSLDEALNYVDKLLKGKGEEMTPAIVAAIATSHAKLQDDAIQMKERSNKLYWGSRSWKRYYDTLPPDLQQGALEKARKNWYEKYDENPAQAMSEIKQSQNTFVVKAITDDIWKKIDNMGITSDAAYQNYKKYKGALISADSIANMRNSKSGDMKYAMIIAYDQFERKTDHMEKKPNFVMNQQAYDMTKAYVSNGYRGLSETASTDSVSQKMLFELLDDDEFNDFVNEKAKNFGAAEQYEYKKDMTLAWIMSGGNMNAIKEAPSRQYTSIKSADVDVKVTNSPHMLDLMKGFSDKYAGKPEQFQKNLATKVGLFLRNKNTPKHNAMIQSIKSQGLTLAATSKEGVYSIMIPNIGFSYDGTSALATGETIDLSNWDGSVPTGEHFGYTDRVDVTKGYNPLGNNAPKTKEWDLPTDKFKVGY